MPLDRPFVIEDIAGSDKLISNLTLEGGVGRLVCRRHKVVVLRIYIRSRRHAGPW